MDLKLYPKQYEALATEAKEIFFGGSLGPGKSYLLRHAAVLFGLYVPDINIYIFRRTFPQVMEGHMYGANGLLSITKEFVDAGLCNVNLSEKRIDFFHPNNQVSRIYLRHCQHESNVYDYQGQEFTLCMIDELGHWTFKMYSYLLSRVRHSKHINYAEVRKKLPFVYDGYFPRVLTAGNPGGIGSNFVKKRFIDPMPPMTIYDSSYEEGGMKRIFIPAYLKENKVLLTEDPHYASRIVAMGGKQAKALLEGDWDSVGDGILDDLWDDSIHVVEPFILPENAYLIRSLDFGTWHPSCVLYTMISNGETVKNYQGNDLYFQPDSQIVIHEIYNWNGNDNEGNRMSAYDVGRQIARYEATLPYRDNIRCGPGDNQIFQNRGGIHQTIHDLLVDGYNDEMATLAKENEGYKWGYDVTKLFIRADQSANSRVQGLNLVRSYLQGALDGESKGLYFFNTCRHCIRTIPTLPRSESNPEDVDTKSEDHLFDIVKYNCLAQRSSFQYLHMSGI